MGNPYAPRKKDNSKTAPARQEEEKKVPETLSKPQNTENTQERSEELQKTEETALTVPEATMEGILDWVGDDKERAAAAIEHEKAQAKPRKTLLSKLGDI